EGVGAADALDERRLARTVIPDQRGDLAGPGLEIDVPEHVNRAEALVHAPHLKDRFVVHGAATPLDQSGRKAAATDSRIGTPPRPAAGLLDADSWALRGVLADAHRRLRRVAVVDRLRDVGQGDRDRLRQDGRDRL